MKSPRYLAYIRSKPCMICGQDSIAHHVRFPGECGMGQKPSDYYAVNLCQYPCHNILHNMGEDRFWREHNIDIKMVIIRLVVDYLKGEK